MSKRRCHGNYNHILAFYIWGARWRHLANTTELSVCSGDAALCQITLTTADDVAVSLCLAACKQCELDPAPTWLIKRCSGVLSPVIAAMINCSFTTAIFPACQKHAIVKPLLKKPSLDLFDMMSYRPVSNLTFIGKFLECFAVKRFHEHASAHCLFPVHQCAYRPRHSTETAVVNVLGDIFRAVDSGKVCTFVLLDLSTALDIPLDSPDGAEGQIWRPVRRVRLVHVIPDWSYSKCQYIN